MAMHELQMEALGTLCISMLDAARPLVPCSPEFNIWSHGCQSVQRQHPNHTDKPGNEPGMPVCGSWGTALPLLLAAEFSVG